MAPRPAIASQKEQQTISELSDAVRARLRELPIVYILILAASTLWSRGVLGREDATIARVDGTIILALVGLIALLWSRCPIPLTSLQALELGAVGLLAGRVTFVEYRLMLRFSQRGDMMTAPMVLKNAVLLTAVLILTYGLYVPKTWRRAALVAGPLALLPFATLSVLALQHPAAMAWLWEGWLDSQTPRALLFAFDALILAILAVGSAYGARTIFRLRRQVAEARQLGQYRLKRRIGAGGMAEVYLAEHQLLKRPCAVKLIRPGVVTDPREMRAVRARGSPHRQALAPEHRRGLRLRPDRGRDVLLRHGVPQGPEPGRAGGPPRPATARPSGLPAAAGLRGVARGARRRPDPPRHQAVEHLRRAPGWAWRCGQAARLRAGPARGDPRRDDLDRGAEILGTPLYMSPEQAKGGHKLDGRSDIYSLGAVAYYLLTGRPPFQADGRTAVLIAHARDPVEPPSRVRPGIPEDLERVVLRCLAKPPDQRFPDAEALEQALGACACAGDWDQGRAAQWWQGEYGDPS